MVESGYIGYVGDLMEMCVIWLMGPPLSGKTTLGKMLTRRMSQNGIRSIHLDSDVVRGVIFKTPSYSKSEKSIVYRILGLLANYSIDMGYIPIVSATGNLKVYRRELEGVIQHPIVKILLRCDPRVLRERDYKGIYRGVVGSIDTVPGLGEPLDYDGEYDYVVDTESRSPVDSLNDLLSIVESILNISLS